MQNGIRIVDASRVEYDDEAITMIWDNRHATIGEIMRVRGCDFAYASFLYRQLQKGA
jgi:hypothetical protein